MRDQPEQPSAARLYLLLLGAALVVGGIAGFAYEAAFGTGDDYVSDNILGIFPTNGWDNLFHLVAGVICLASASRFPLRMALGIGILFAALGIWGMLVTERGAGALLETIPVATEDNLLHLAIGLIGIAAAAPLGRDFGGGGGRPPAAA